MNWQVTNCVSSLSVGTTHTQRLTLSLCVSLLRRTSSLRFSPSVRRRFDSHWVPLWIPHMFFTLLLAVRSCIFVRDPTVVIPLYEPLHLFSCGSSTEQMFINVDVFGFKYLSLQFFGSSSYEVIHNYMLLTFLVLSGYYYLTSKLSICCSIIIFLSMRILFSNLNSNMFISV